MTGWHDKMESIRIRKEVLEKLKEIKKEFQADKNCYKTYSQIIIDTIIDAEKFTEIRLLLETFDSEHRDNFEYYNLGINLRKIIKR